MPLGLSLINFMFDPTVMGNICVLTFANIPFIDLALKYRLSTFSVKGGEAKQPFWIFHHSSPEILDTNPETFVLISRWVPVSAFARVNGVHFTPLHLLSLCKTFGNDVVHCRFDEGRADSVSLAIALPEVGYECLIVCNVRLKFSNSSQNLCVADFLLPTPLFWFV